MEQRRSGLRNPVPILVAAIAAAVILGLACSSKDTDIILEREVIEHTMEVTSSAFANGDSIPAKYTCDGDDVSPELSWSKVPKGTKTIAVIADDPDAPGGTWVHWVLYGLSPDTARLPESGPPPDALDGKNDFGKTGYGGPCPPPGGPHRYFFKVYALDAELTLGPGATKADLVREMSGSILAQGELMGRYARR